MTPMVNHLVLSCAGCHTDDDVCGEPQLTTVDELRGCDLKTDNLGLHGEDVERSVCRTPFLQMCHRHGHGVR
jgi:hypothetical protein